MHPDLEDYEVWADEIEHEEEPRRFAKRAPDEDLEKEMSLWSSLD